MSFMLFNSISFSVVVVCVVCFFVLVFFVCDAGWFRYVKGFLIGRPLVHGQEMMGLDQYHAVLDIIAHHNVPVIMDADLGHIAPMLPLISGSYANITATGNNLVVDMKLK